MAWMTDRWALGLALNWAQVVRAREQSAHHADIRFEHLHVAVDIEMKMALDLAHTFFEFAVEAHHI